MPYRDAIVPAEPPRPSRWARLRAWWWRRLHAYDRGRGVSFEPVPDWPSAYRRWSFYAALHGRIPVYFYEEMPAHWRAVFAPPKDSG